MVTPPETGDSPIAPSRWNVFKEQLKSLLSLLKQNADILKNADEINRELLYIIFIIAKLGNLYTFLGVTLTYFIMAEVGNLLEKIIDPMTIMIRVTKLIAECF
jgi:hemolysin-activating ACP:hemolysin acyltransferase